MRPGPAAGAARLSARSGVAPAMLLDVVTPAGNVYYWSDRKLVGVQAAAAYYGIANVPEFVSYQPWLLGSGALRFNRSLVTDTGTLTIQNISGDVLSRDFERIARKSTLEGSLFVFRYYAIDMGYALIEQHGTLSVSEQGNTATLNLQQLGAGSDDTPQQQVSETCQLMWAEHRCGANPDNAECLYTFASCQVVERFVGIQTAFEVNNPATIAALATTTFNRARAW